MDLADFKKFMQKRKIKDDNIASSIAIVKEFDEFLTKYNRSAENALYDDVHNFSAYLIENNRNIFDNYVGLLRFGQFTKNNQLTIASMENIDGSEVMTNFSKRLIDKFGEEVRNKIFDDIEVPPMGLHPQKKPEITKKVIERFLAEVNHEKCAKFLANGLRDKYTASYKPAREKFLKAKSIDKFLEIKRQDFINTLKNHLEEGKLFFTQEVDEEVLEYVKNQQGMTEAGIRDGNKVLIKKIPYMTKQYLKETDEKKKRYYYCHCPWVREALLEDDQPVDPIFCNCSGGYYKNFWEAVLDQPVHIELLESVLMGDMACKFALQLPQEIIDTIKD
ncbi:MAG: hypothetical protein ACFFAJ_16385 [Candidatus Hodarchaeota archaeon]